MATRPETPELAVDELKRRARRRLVGAIVLALAAAVVLPMLLESKPRPLGDDVSIKIPPIDSGKFVNPLSPETTGPSTAPSAIRAGTAPEPGAANAGAPGAERRPLERSATAVAPAADARRDAPAAASSSAAADIGASGKSAAPATSATSSTDVPAGAFVVQIGAFADAQAAGDLAAKLKIDGFTAYTEPSGTGQGNMQRVRVGPFASREAADAALAKVKSAGYGNAIVTAK